MLDAEASQLSVPEDRTVTLSLSGDDVFGTGPCNPFRGTADWGCGGSVEFKNVAATQMACEPAVMEAESEFLDALNAVDHAKVDVDEDGHDDRDVLTLAGSGNVRLVFRRYDARDQLVGTWGVTGVLSGDAIVSAVAPREPTLTFEDDGRLAVDTGCNTGGGDWELDGHDLTVEPIALSRKECQPPEVMEQEAAIAAALDGAAALEVTPRSLTIFDEEGRVVLTAEPA